MAGLEHILSYVVTGIEVVSAAILLTGFLKALVAYLRAEFRKTGTQKRFEVLSDVRLELGTYILLGLDFYIVSDIIHSMIHPEFDELINLALIVVLRTTIGFFLGKEIAEIEARARNREES